VCEIRCGGQEVIETITTPHSMTIWVRENKGENGDMKDAGGGGGGARPSGGGNERNCTWPSLDSTQELKREKGQKRRGGPSIGETRTKTEPCDAP